jgi:hypothetical protein
LNTGKSVSKLVLKIEGNLVKPLGQRDLSKLSPMEVVASLSPIRSLVRLSVPEDSDLLEVFIISDELFEKKVNFYAL